MQIQLIIAALVYAIGFGSAWKIQSVRADAKEQKHVEQILADQRTAAASNIRRLDNVISAQDKATGRLVALRRDADASHWALVSLSSAADAALRTGQDSQAACPVTANTLRDVLGTMAEAGGTIAAQADRHASDVQTLIDAWPR